jgi:hypothetical protein
VRIPFDEAVKHEGMLKRWWKELSFAQQTVLLAAYGCELDAEEKDDRGWTRMDYWWASQGFATHDEDGFLTAVHPPAGAKYVPHEYSEVWIVAGIRWGKSDRIAATAVVYEALCGGHEDRIRAGKRGHCLQVCQDLRLAKESLHGIESILKLAPFIQKRLPYKTKWSGKNGERIGRRTADSIGLWNGMAITTMPPTVKAIRGYDSPVAVLDEIGIWPVAEDAANVDKEVYSQAKSRQAQFGGFSKIIGISSPWISSGKLFEMFQIGTQGCKILCGSCQARGITKGCPTCQQAREGYKDVLVCHFTTAVGNTSIAREWFTQYRLTDPVRFARECLAQFQSSASAFLNPYMIDRAVEANSKGIRERREVWPRNEKESMPHYKPIYVAAIDSGLRSDNFTFGISHVNERGRVQIDYLRRWEPKKDGKKALNPKEIFQEIAPILRAYRIMSVSADQSSHDALNQLALNEGFALDEANFSNASKKAMYDNLRQLLYQERMDLLDEPESIAELKLLQRKVTKTNQVVISAPEGRHDDYATIIAIMADKCLWLLPISPPAASRYVTPEQRDLEKAIQQAGRQSEFGLN